MTPALGKFLYGTLFTVLAPAGIVMLSRRLDRLGAISWPLPIGVEGGIALGVCGIVIVLWSMALLVLRGEGLPMNAYPTKRWVTAGPYRVFGNPIYVGFTMAVAGGAICFRSPSAFWLVTPICAAACIALVAGYEGRATRDRLGPVDHAPLLRLPPNVMRRASMPTRVLAGILSLGIWACLYTILSAIPTSPERIESRMGWELLLPVMPEAVWIYTAAYLPVILAPLAVRTEGDLRRFIVATWLACALGFGTMILLPLKAAWVMGPLDPWTGWMLSVNRAVDAEWLALPSFHAYWIVMAAIIYARAWPAASVASSALAAAGLASCVLSGQHSVLDVAVGMLLALACWHHPTVWRVLLRAVERVANSWSSVRIGPVRLLSSGVPAALAGFTGILLACWLCGPERSADILAVNSLALLAAGAWAYLLEGGEKLARPFGFFGYLLGGTLALAAFSIANPDGAGELAASLVTGGALGQGVGRIRCMMQGCCHGRPSAPGHGIHVRNARSRAVAYEHLWGVAIYPTQLYSLIANLAICLILWSLWDRSSSWSFIVGAYLVLSALTRFVEEGYRGESQTPICGRLSIYQWLTCAVFVAGLGFVCLDTAPVAISGVFEFRSVLAAAVFGITIFVAMGVDFPDCDGPGSRLSPR